MLSKRHLTVSLITKNHNDNILPPVWLPTFYSTQLGKDFLWAPLLLKSSAVSTKIPTVWPCQLISHVHQVAKSVFFYYNKNDEWHHVFCHTMRKNTVLFSQEDQPSDHGSWFSRVTKSLFYHKNEWQYILCPTMKETGCFLTLSCLNKIVRLTSWSSRADAEPSAVCCSGGRICRRWSLQKQELGGAGENELGAKKVLRKRLFWLSLCIFVICCFLWSWLPLEAW